jgi:hypothetical protein
MTAIRWMKGLCLVCVGFFLLGAVAQAFSVGAFKSLKHVSKHPRPEQLPKEVTNDFGHFVTVEMSTPLGNVLHAVFCYAICCIAERFALRKPATAAERDCDDRFGQSGGARPVQGAN